MGYARLENKTSWLHRSFFRDRLLPQHLRRFVIRKMIARVTRLPATIHSDVNVTRLCIVLSMSKRCWKWDTEYVWRYESASLIKIKPRVVTIVTYCYLLDYRKHSLDICSTMDCKIMFRRLWFRNFKIFLLSYHLIVILFLFATRKLLVFGYQNWHKIVFKNWNQSKSLLCVNNY